MFSLVNGGPESRPPAVFVFLQVLLRSERITNGRRNLLMLVCTSNSTDILVPNKTIEI